MEKPYLLHLITPAKNASPFDVNMAYDAGWDAITPYTNVELDDVAGLTQDAIFSRGPKGVRRTGFFIGGREMVLAMDMLDNARDAMVPPFEISVFADPSGAFTTAAAMVAAVEKQLAKTFGESLDGQKIVVLGGTGPVGSAASVIAAKAGASVTVMGRQKDKADRVAALCNHAYGADMTGIKGDANDHKGEQLEEATVVLGTAAAGVQVMNKDDVAAAKHLKVAADLNAVPPEGIAGVGVMDDGVPIPDSSSGAVGIGALVVGNIKYQTQNHLLQQMREADSPMYLHFEHAFEFARSYLQND
ncbi:MAG TPA: methylenetetrahydromethanopterin dehydrogenase [Chromatiales bacterium]|nr:methylenetetrahydromethanopterin dehydrogenase [Thiotrichales bacterium]HIP68979.1 methylenetetrahydromethanopterin dehydrogenase [Chromatiales bacterium]